MYIQNDNLILYREKGSTDLVIPLSEITAVEKIHTPRFRKGDGEFYTYLVRYNILWKNKEEAPEAPPKQHLSYENIYKFLKGEGFRFRRIKKYLNRESRWFEARGELKPNDKWDITYFVIGRKI